MGKRLRLAQALADDELEGVELELAKSNRIIVQESERIKKQRMKLKDVEIKTRGIKHGG